MKQLKIEKQITKRDSTSLRNYLNDISKYPRITPEEESELARRIRQGDEKALEKLVNANLRFVVSVAKQYQHMRVPLEDLINNGNKGLVIAAKKFDETRGFKFISYAVWWIRQSILEAAAVTERVIRLPQNQILRLGKIKQAQSKLEQELGRDPTAEELGKELKLDPHVISDLVESAAFPSSIDKPVGEDETGSLADLLVNQDTPGPDRQAMEDSLKKELHRSLDILSGREKEIIELFFGIGQKESMSDNQIAYKYGLEAERISQIRKKALKQLRKSSLLRGLRNQFAN